MTAYNDFSLVYDSLMSDSGVDYLELCEQLLSLCKSFGHTPRLALDAGCGTGSFMQQLLQRGIDAIGVDSSEGMLNLAQQKLAEYSPLLLCQPLCRLDLYGTVDTVFCTMDTLNHITDLEELKSSIQRISLFLERGGLFVFDVNTLYKHRFVLANNTFVYENERVYLVWQNEQCGEDTVNINLDLFVTEGSSYRRLNENFDERAYPIALIERLLSQCGLRVLNKSDFYKRSTPTAASEKIIIVAQKK